MRSEFTKIYKDMQNAIITQKQREEIRQVLPRGSMARIARACGCSRMAVTLWFRGGESIQIATAVVEELERIVKQREVIQSRLQELLR